ncbi:murein transglycosylase A [Thorsellia anophelis]|uniref:Membrane-bound lytic murein transglycosylase A n=1 Tax=Thorsellia anophelis DSM 18579 TaxID=1123402 RepID=A0A1I0EFA3_9GAMM|nr:murein transglycosylase A [Thorsellia anophelis]SET43116.1 membrane-bound lytic murein transglycosylase A [Thorsellia anophelis DSM 18579]
MLTYYFVRKIDRYISTKQMLYYSFVIFFLFVLSACQSKIEPVKIQTQEVDLSINKTAFIEQYEIIQEYSSKLTNENKSLYQCTKKWLESGADETKLSEFGLTRVSVFSKDDNKALFTGYYSPVLKGRKTKSGEFIYPLYSKPNISKGKMPTRTEIHGGALEGLGLELAYTQSRVDNFIMGVQGSGYVDFEDGNPPTYFAYGGQNGHKFKGIGKYLIEQGELTLENVSLKSIYEWTQSHSEEEVLALLNQNPSWVFFQPKEQAEVKGAANIPLIGHGAVAADKSIFPFGSIIYAHVPHVDIEGKFSGQYKPRLFFALDVGGAIKNNHFDIYHGLGDEAGLQAGNNKFKGDAWQLAKTNEAVHCL